MSQVTGPIVINDGATTPVAKSFLPMSVSTDLSVFTERSAPFSAAYPKLTLGFDSANGGRKTNRIPIKMDLPVTAVVAGVDAVVRTHRFEGVFILADTGTTSERADLHAFVANAINHELVKAMVKDLDPLY